MSWGNLRLLAMDAENTLTPSILHSIRVRGEGAYQRKHHLISLKSQQEPSHGFLKMIENPEGFHIDEVRTRRRHAGEGIAHKLLTHATKFADSQGKRITLERVPQNNNVDDTRLKSLYQKHGFKDYYGPVAMVRNPKPAVLKGKVATTSSSPAQSVARS